MFISLPLQIKCVQKLLQDMQSSPGSRAEEHTAGLPWATTRSKIFKHLQMVKIQTVVGNTHLKPYGQGWAVSTFWAMWHTRDSSGVPTLQESPVQKLLDYANLWLQEKGCLHCQTAMRASNPAWGSEYQGRHLQLLITFSSLSLLRLLIQGQEIDAFAVTPSALSVAPELPHYPSKCYHTRLSWLGNSILVKYQVSGKNITASKQYQLYLDQLEHY